MCKAQGLTGNQGVIIPEDNRDNLMLNEDVIQAVEEGQFHIYPVKTVTEGLDVLTEVEVGSKKKNGKYEEGTIFARADEKIREIHEALQNGENGEED